MILRRATFALAAALTALTASPARAADEEIQVYLDEINPAGAIGLDVHLNTVTAGDSAPAYPGAERALHRWRITPEFSLGLGGGFELGAYLPLATIAADGVLRAEGAKGRLKWLAPHGERGFYWGANLEIGRVDSRLDRNPWNGELKLIGGWRNDRWIVGVNGNIGFKVSGPDPAPASFELASKLGYRLTPKLTLGLESYNGLGEFRDFGRLGASDHATFLTFDTAVGGWDINAGIGKGYGTSADDTIVKFVIGVPIGR